MKAIQIFQLQFELKYLSLDAKVVGEVLAEIRKEKGISQEVLSGLADIG
jgi:hypothetical protein